MVDDPVDCLWSLISFLIHLFNLVNKAILRYFETNVNFVNNIVEKSDLVVKNEEKTVVVDHAKVTEKTNTRRRPAMIVIPKSCLVGSGFRGVAKEEEGGGKELEVEGNGYCLVGKRGRRHKIMEDGYGVMTNINGDSKQAFFGVFDGHGGRAAVDFVSEKLGENIVRAVSDLQQGGGGGEDWLEMAMKSGYLTTDTQFLNQGECSGTCAATVLLKNGELHVGNVGDCRVVMSKKGEAHTLTSDHKPGREDERSRIQNSGGYVSCRNGVWRVQDELAVSRSIGDANLKEWIISEPETRTLHLTPECEFLILASDGLWDKVTDQEAVDMVSRSCDFVKSCKELVEVSCSRGSRDDITVMLVDLHRFLQ